NPVIAKWDRFDLRAVEIFIPSIVHQVTENATGLL
ncbi:MAG: hypothetical protein UW16_C0043G0001, partial [Microgenomates group bacterium GW2011_GWC1_44_10]